MGGEFLFLETQYIVSILRCKDKKNFILQSQNEVFIFLIKLKLLFNLIRQTLVGEHVLSVVFFVGVVGYPIAIKSGKNRKTHLNQKKVLYRSYYINLCLF